MSTTVFIISGTTYTTPANFVSLVSLNGIGAGNQEYVTAGGAGGPAGAFAVNTSASLSASTSYNIQIGIKNNNIAQGTSASPVGQDTWFSDASSILYAQGAGRTYDAPGLAANCVPTTGAANGGQGSATGSGGGGGAGGPNGAGNPGVLHVGGSGDAGFGGAGGGAGANGGNGTEWTASVGGTAGSGGGGGGSAVADAGNGGNYGAGAGDSVNFNEGNSGPGLIVFIYVPFTPLAVSLPEIPRQSLSVIGY